MIRITQKAAVPPHKLRVDGQKAARELTDAYESGVRNFPSSQFDPSIYGDPSVKNELIRAQHGKCCFCESIMLHITDGDVEHFRPKAGYKQKKGDALQKPGYFWLAYDWDNLFLACVKCNQRQKANLFPLANPANRATSHHDSIDREKPLFIHPARDNPKQHISFRGAVCYAVRNSKRGKETIDALGLDRKELEERRQKQYEIFKMLHKVATTHPDPAMKSEAASMIRSYSREDGEYTSMLAAAKRDNFRY